MKSIKANYIFWGYIIVLSILCIFITPNYGITGDEVTQWKYGNYVWQYLKNSGNVGDLFKTSFPGHEELKYYGGIFDGITALFIDVIHPKNEFLLRHYFNMFFGLLTILFSGLIAKEISQKWSTGLLAALFLTITPRFFGEMFNNPKDIPFAAGYIISIYYIIKFLKNIELPKWKYTFGLSIGIAVAIGVRIGGLLVIAYLGLFFLLFAIYNKNVNMNYYKKALIHATISVLLGYIIACIWWPYALEDILTNPIESLKIMASYPLSIYMLFDGARVNTASMPSNYLFQWLWVGTPIFLLIGIFGSLYILFKNKSNQNFIFIGLLIFSFGFPIFYIIYKKAVVYDALRHIIFVMPPMAILGSLFYCFLYEKYALSKNNKIIAGVLMMALMILPLKHMISNHPNQYIYFNEIFGGVDKAFGYYELDYYQNSGKVATDWIKQNILKNKNEKVKILSNLGTIDKYFFDVDTSKLFVSYGRWRERDHLDWDYYVAYSRFIEPENLQNHAWPPKNTIHEIKVDNTPVLVIIERKNKADIEAFQALEKNDFVLALSKYQESIKNDDSNEYIWYYYAITLANTGQIDMSIQAMKKAIELNGSNPEWYQLIAKLYNQKGEAAYANMYNNLAQEKINSLTSSN